MLLRAEYTAFKEVSSLSQFFFKAKGWGTTFEHSNLQLEAILLTKEIGRAPLPLVSVTDLSKDVNSHDPEARQAVSGNADLRATLTGPLSSIVRCFVHGEKFISSNECSSAQEQRLLI